MTGSYYNKMMMMIEALSYGPMPPFCSLAKHLIFYLSI